MEEVKVREVENEEYFISNVKNLRKSLELMKSKPTPSKEKEEKLKKIYKSLLELEENSALLLLKEEPKKVEEKKRMELPIIKTSFSSKF